MLGLGLTFENVSFEKKEIVF